MYKRQRLFFGLTDLSAFTFVGLGLLRLLSFSKKAEGIHGQLLQKQLYESLGQTWVASNNLLYTVLHTYEKEGYVISRWDQSTGDPNKRSFRYYSITEQGFSYLQHKKAAYIEKLEYMVKLWDASIKILWGNAEIFNKDRNLTLFSSTLYSRVNILYFLSQMPKETPYVYGRRLKELINNAYGGLWAPTDSVLYTTLSDMDTEGLTQSEWTTNDEVTFSKKRTAREYRITEQGRHMLSTWLKEESGIKQKITDMRTLCEEAITLMNGRLA